MRLILQFGAPLDMTSKEAIDDEEQKGVRYNDIKDRERDQKVYVANFQYKIVDIIDEFKKENENGLQVGIFSEAVT